jgi:nucleoid-associated protein YgaU
MPWPDHVSRFAAVVPASFESDSSEPAAALVAAVDDFEFQPVQQSTGLQSLQPNDSFWLISERAYGSGVYYRALYEHNRDICPLPDRLPAGGMVNVPPLEELRLLYLELCPPQENRP